jgi:L-fucose isomerase-like protein
MLRILPVAAGLHGAEAARATIDGVSRDLARRGVAHEMREAGPDRPDAVLMVTGGTEHRALASLEGEGGPAFLIAHAAQNSLPAALEVLGRLRQSGRAARIYLVNGGEEGCEGLGRLDGLLGVRRRLRASRLGRIGTPSDWLVASTPDPGDVTGAWGPTVVDVPITRLLEAVTDVDPRDVERIRDDFVGGAVSVPERASGAVDGAARVAAALARLVHDERLDACTVRCFDLVGELRTTGCLALSWLLDAGIVAGCEGDVPATLTMMWLEAMTGRPAFMANPQDLDLAANALWLAHCTVARGLVTRYALDSHFESDLGIGIAGRLEAGPATIARIGGTDLRSLFAADARITRCGDHPSRCRTQVEVAVDAPLAGLLTSALGNHHVLSRGHWAAALREYHDLFVANQT